jgi:hypothetical protein
MSQPVLFVIDHGAGVVPALPEAIQREFGYIQYLTAGHAREHSVTPAG